MSTIICVLNLKVYKQPEIFFSATTKYERTKRLSPHLGIALDDPKYVGRHTRTLFNHWNMNKGNFFSLKKYELG